MEIILIVVAVVLIVYLFWPKNKKPATPITKSRTTPETADPEPDTSEEKEDKTNIRNSGGDASEAKKE